MEDFSYLAIVITADGKIDKDSDRRIAYASKAFGALRRAVLKDANLSVTAKRLAYQACVLSVLLNDAESWIPRAKARASSP